MKLNFVCRALLLLLLPFTAFAQEKLDYQKPPQEILELVDISRAPSTYLDSKGENVVLLYRDQYKSIAELSAEEMRLAGLRINPKTNIGSRVTFFNKLAVKKTDNPEINEVAGLPESARLSNFRWSPDQKYMSFLNTTDKGNELWVLEVEKASAKKLTEATVNANMGNPVSWFDDNDAVLVKMVPSNRKDLIDVSQSVPGGPTITTSSGEKAQNRTYQDLLKNPNDEHNFEQLALSEIYKVSLNGDKKKWLPQAMYRGVSFSPDGKYVMVTTVQRPFSYIVPYYRFASETSIYDADGKPVHRVMEVPLTEVLPKGFMSVRKGRRSMSWRNDKAATLYWAEALDEGDPEKEVDYRDEIFELDAPFDGEPKSLLKTKDRFYQIRWGTDEVAVAYDYWWNTRHTYAYLFNPSDASQEPKIIEDRSYQDRYGDPGDFVSERNKYHRSILSINDGKVYLLGDGYTKEGQFPFVDEMNLSTLEKKRLYQSEYTDKKEDLSYAFDMKKGNILVRIESKNEYPNYYIRNIYKNTLNPVTNYKNPFESIANVHKEVISYKRDDGLELEGTLYLPLGYDKEKKEKVPLIIWAYPVEYKDKNSASQKTSNPNEFVYPYYGSMVYWVTRGYAILDDASFPIVGEGEEEPNDSFRKQLVGNAKAAIDAVDKLGYIDRKRVGVGGHSYGAFMVANLLSHSNLFAAGIARSGAYNRTLTPFGFQSEERSYWDAPEVYYTMSPFMHADKMKTPLLLIHGEADNNSGTYPLQSERYFNALKGLGAPARLVMLPKESHGYRAKESILHLLWEQDQWLEKYVKNREQDDSKAQAE